MNLLNLRSYMTLCLALIASLSLAGAPAGYYNSAQGLSGDSLRNALHNIIDGHNSLSYNGAKDELWEVVDVQNGQITCVYSGRVTTSLSRDTDGMNAEHTWPQSRGAGSTPPRSDLHHLFVTDSTWNSRRGSLRFKNVTSPDETSPTGAKVDFSQGFEPPDINKGDIARAIFYFSVRYEIDVINNSSLQGSNGSTSDDMMGELDDLLEWHFADPPSAFEQTRNDRVYVIQGNRNPFVDHPEYITAMFNLGPVAPVITTSLSPASPQYTDSTFVRALIDADSAINSSTVKTFWRIGSTGAFNEQSMSLLSGSTTNGTWQMDTPIPPQNGGTEIQYYVEATDTNAASARSPETGTASFTVIGPEPPTVSLTVLPSQPRYDETTTIRATITSDNPIQANGVTLFWKTSAEVQFNSVMMNQISGTSTNGQWEMSTPIPLQSGGTVIQYYATAIDSFPLETRSPLSGELSFTVFEPGAPVADAFVSPEAPRVGQSILISANITSEAGVNPSTVEAAYSTTDGRSGTLAMSRVSGTDLNGVWEANSTIDSLDVGDVLSYAVSLEDVDARADRDPDSGFKTVTVTDIPLEINVGGYTLTETDSNIVVQFPANTIIPANGTLVVGRQSTESEFESFWGALPNNAVYINAFDIVGGNGLVVNGDEVFELEDAQNILIDGPTATSALSAKNQRLTRASTSSNIWSEEVDTNASPGVWENGGTGQGLVITEIVDPDTGFEEAFVEIYYDAPSPIIVNFTADITVGTAPLTVQFTDATSGGSPSNFQWDFDNDANIDSTQQNPSYTFTVPGTYSVKMTNSEGEKTRFNLITVNPPAGPDSNLYIFH